MATGVKTVIVNFQVSKKFIIISIRILFYANIAQINFSLIMTHNTFIASENISSLAPK